MPCVCGQKVDRQEVNKVLCIICKQFAHIKCYNIKINELDLIKNKFKCKRCISDRRASLCSSPVLVTSPLPESAEAVKKGVEPTALLSSEVSGNSQTVPDAAGGNGILVHDNLCLKPAVTLDLLFNEIAALRSIVIALREDNTLLSKKVFDLELTVKNMHVSLPNEIADKCVMQRQIYTKTNASLLTERACTVSSPTSLTNTATKDSLSVVSPITSLAQPKTYASVSKCINTGLENNTGVFSAAPHLSPAVTHAVTSMSRVVSVDSGLLVNDSHSDVNAGQHNVNKEQSRQLKNLPTVFGVSDSDELGVYDKHKWYHLSSFKPSVSAKNIIEYVVRKTGIADKHLLCYKLIKRDKDENSLKFVNFKLGVSECYYTMIFDSSIWPANIKIRPFRFLEKVDQRNNQM